MHLNYVNICVLLYAGYPHTYIFLYKYKKDLFIYTNVVVLNSCVFMCYIIVSFLYKSIQLLRPGFEPGLPVPQTGVLTTRLTELHALYNI